MNIAVVGTGVSGLAAAWALDREHDVVLYEADPRAGGHVHTHSVDDPVHGPLAVDSGFIVYNERNYPGLVGLLDELGVATRESDMSFAVTCRRCRLEYCGRGASGLFAERRNLVRPALPAAARRHQPVLPRGQGRARATRAGSAARSATSSTRAATDAASSATSSRPWAPRSGRPLPTTCARCPPRSSSASSRTTACSASASSRAGAPSTAARGGTWTRCSPASEADLRVGAPVRELRRSIDGVELRAGDDEVARFDRVIIATHPNEALALLGDPSDEERAALGSIRYSRNEAVVHTDSSMLPAHVRCPRLVERRARRLPPRRRRGRDHLLDEPPAGSAGPDRLLRLAERRGPDRP